MNLLNPLMFLINIICGIIAVYSMKNRMYGIVLTAAGLQIMALILQLNCDMNKEKAE